LKDYSKRNILSEYASLGDFIQKWNDADKKQVIIEALEEK
jgi:type I restriction enzyme, R subunit